MLKKFSLSDQQPTTVLLCSMSCFCIALIVSRCMFSNSLVYVFLIWNLFLAMVPWLLSSSIIRQPHTRWFSFRLWFSLALWILFFPNAPYILTDLFHLHSRSTIPLWFDLALILSFAFTGLMFGIVSLFDLEHFFRSKLSERIIAVSVSVVLFLAGFGVYLGRFERWNSWDILQNPVSLMLDIADRFIHPFDHPRTWAVTFLMGILLNFMYWSVRFLGVSNHNHRLAVLKQMR